MSLMNEVKSLKVFLYLKLELIIYKQLIKG